MRRSATLILLVVTVCSVLALAQDVQVSSEPTLIHTAVTQDGNLVLLLDDHTWGYSLASNAPIVVLDELPIQFTNVMLEWFPQRPSECDPEYVIPAHLLAQITVASNDTSLVAAQLRFVLLDALNGPITVMAIPIRLRSSSASGETSFSATVICEDATHMEQIQRAFSDGTLRVCLGVDSTLFQDGEEGGWDYADTFYNRSFANYYSSGPWLPLSGTALSAWDRQGTIFEVHADGTWRELGNEWMPIVVDAVTVEIVRSGSDPRRPHYVIPEHANLRFGCTNTSDLAIEALSVDYSLAVGLTEDIIVSGSAASFESLEAGSALLTDVGPFDMVTGSVNDLETKLTAGTLAAHVALGRVLFANGMVIDFSNEVIEREPIWVLADGY